LQALAKHRFILREKGSGTRMAGDRFFRQNKFRPDVRLELGSNEAIKESVAGGLGIGLVSRHALHGLQKEHGVSVIQVEGFPLPSAWHIVHPLSKKLSPLASAFKAHLIQEVAQGSGEGSV
jgi:DNA-binding transcriptional LysR family regulator